jgi:hypothetical protein
VRSPLMYVFVALVALAVPAQALEQAQPKANPQSAGEQKAGAPPSSKQEPATVTPKQESSAQTKPAAVQPSLPAASQPVQTESAAQVELEKELTKLATTLNTTLGSKKEEKKTVDSIVDFLSKLAALVATILGSFVTYKGLRKIPAVRDNSEILILALGAVIVLVLFYLLSGLVTSVLYVLVAILVLLIALVLATAHLIKFIDEKYPDVKDSIIAHFSESSSEASLRRTARDNVRGMCNWLLSLSFIQQINGEPEMELIGAIAEGYKKSLFKIHPDGAVAPFWKNVDDRLLVPVMISVTFHADGESVAELVNIQPGLVVIKVGDKFKYAAFDNKGFQLMAASLLQKQQERTKKILEQQIELRNNLNVFNSQSV